MKKKTTYIWIAVSAVSLIAAILVARLFLYADHYRNGNLLIAGVVIALLAWKAFIKDGREEIASLKRKVSELDRELAEKNSSKLNVVELNPILHVAVLDVDTSFVRPYVREKDGISFNGALKADLKVEYGIRLEEVRFNYDKASNTLSLANFHPGIISYSRKQLSWEFARSFRSRSILGYELPEVSDSEAAEFTSKMCEKLRNELEKEIDTRRVSEFAWLSPLITDQVVDVLKLMVGSANLNVNILEDSGPESVPDGYVSLQEFKQSVSAPQIENQ